MEGSFYNLRQRPFPVSITADSLATVVTSSVSTVTSDPPTGNGRRADRVQLRQNNNTTKEN